MNCKICNTESNIFDNGLIMGKYKINYFHCPHCGFIQTEEPYWLTEAYSSAIADTDIGLIQRNIMLSEKINTILKLLNKPNHLLDYGGGYGMFVRMMRDKGWDFEWYDQYCENLFAQHHEMKRDRYDVVTSFEMLEHLTDPLSTLEKILKKTDTFICTTELVPANPPKIKDWWYYATESGQHISFYTLDSLKTIAQKFKKHFYSGFGIHIFSSKHIPSNKIKLTFENPKLANKLFDLKDKPSLLGVDYYNLTGKHI